MLVGEDALPSTGILEQAWLPGIVASLVLHLWLFSTFSSLDYSLPDIAYVPPIQTRVENLEQPPEELDPVVEYELANPDDRDHELHEAVNARSVGMSLSHETKLESAPVTIVDSLTTIPVQQVYDIPEGQELDERLVVKGTTGESMIQIDAALDRVTREIADNLQERKVLAVWLVDASGSLIEQRKIIAKRMRRIYGELQALEQSGQIPRMEQPLLSAVVTFGIGTKFITPEPTADVTQIIDAMENAPTDPSGVENVFGAVRQVLDRWLVYRAKHGRRIMILTVTDEAGDDFSQNLEPAIKVSKNHGARVYVIGPSSPFGRRQGFVPYIAPEDGKTYQLPVDLGPETAVAENVQLPFWFNGPQHEYLSSGLGPYALERLVQETGGVYFLTNMTTTTGLATTGSYAAQNMKLFQPDYRFGKPEDYLKDLSKHPLRRAVVEAADRSLRFKAKGTPDLELRVNQGNYLQTLTRAQQTVAESSLMIDNILEAFRGNLEAEYEKEDSPRWRMAYNLALGRLLAQKIRCFEYNYACAQMKTMGAQDVANKSNHWIFRPDPNINYATSMKKTAMQAEKLLRRVLDEAPGTPWAVMASRELKDPFGMKIIERYDPPAPPPTANNTPATPSKKGMLLLADDRPKPKTPPSKPAPPPPPPKLPKI